MSELVIKVGGFDFDEERAKLPATKLELYLISRSLMNYFLAQQLSSSSAIGVDRELVVNKLHEAESLLDELLAGLVTQGGRKLDDTNVEE